MFSGNQRVIKAEKFRVVEKLNENMEKHLQEYEDALKCWLLEVIDKSSALQSRIRKIQQHDELAFEDIPSSNLGLDRKKPTLHIKDYERALAMLDLHVDNEIELTAEDVQQYVMDDWDWKEAFQATVSAYKS